MPVDDEMLLNEHYMQELSSLSLLALIIRNISYTKVFRINQRKIMHYTENAYDLVITVTVAEFEIIKDRRGLTLRQFEFSHVFRC